MDMGFINRIKGYAALFMAVMAANLLVPVDGYSSEREYPDIILNTRITPDLFEKSRSVHFVKDGWAFYVRDVRIASNNKYLAWTEIFPLSPSYEWYYLLYWSNGNIAIIKHWLVNESVGLWTAYGDTGEILDIMYDEVEY